MKAHQIMTKEVVTVGPGTTVGEIATLLIDHRVSAVPVVSDDDRVAGIISESDLCHRAETSTERKRKWWLELFTDKDALAREYVKTHGLKAEDVMSRVVVSVPEDAELAEVADILDAHRVRRVPVMRDGRLVGIISRSDIVLALTQVQVGASVRRPDSGALQKAILDEIRDQPWHMPSSISVTVKDGAVELWGVVDTADQRRALRVLVEGISGVQSVDDNVQLYPRTVAV